MPLDQPSAGRDSSRLSFTTSRGGALREGTSNSNVSVMTVGADNKCNKHSNRVQQAIEPASNLDECLGQGLDSQERKFLSKKRKAGSWTAMPSIDQLPSAAALLRRAGSAPQRLGHEESANASSQALAVWQRMTERNKRLRKSNHEHSVSDSDDPEDEQIDHREAGETSSSHDRDHKVKTTGSSAGVSDSETNVFSQEQTYFLKSDQLTLSTAESSFGSPTVEPESRGSSSAIGDPLKKLGLRKEMHDVASAADRSSFLSDEDPLRKELSATFPNSKRSRALWSYYSLTSFLRSLLAKSTPPSYESVSSVALDYASHCSDLSNAEICELLRKDDEKIAAHDRTEDTPIDIIKE